MPEPANATAKKYAKVMNRVLRESSYWEAEAKRLRALHEPTDSVLIEVYLVAESSVTFFYMHVSVLNCVGTDGKGNCHGYGGSCL